MTCHQKSKSPGCAESTVWEIFIEKRLVQWKNQPFGDIMSL
jgi:hypothetical protein